MSSIAYFVSPHGLGHAARACAVIEAMHRRWRDLRCQIFTTAPGWFFAESLRLPYTLHHTQSDVGLVQITSLDEDLEATVESLDRFLPFSPDTLQRLAEVLRGCGCKVVVCDISALGIAVAQVAGLPAVLVENFTWDWIYAGYDSACPALGEHARILGELFAAADLHLQTEPTCRPCPTAVALPPVSREPRTARRDLRKRLGVPEQAPLVLLSMGGVPWRYSGLEDLADHPSAYFVVPGTSSEIRRQGHLIPLAFESQFYHPDLVHASDAVVGKLGYSTLAEAYHAGIALAFIPRPRFPESAVLQRFVSTTMGGVELTAEEFSDASWLRHLDRLLEAPPHRQQPRSNGAATAASLIADAGNL